ncbi:hypothetical protein WICPIJ_004410, partial [Wickerhamomyces pijperi]
TGLGEWASVDENIRNTDVVVWATLALTHPPSTEQFPVMPSDFMQFIVGPSSFFERNPALDVPLATNKVNKSKYYEDVVAGAGVKSNSTSQECCKHSL